MGLAASWGSAATTINLDGRNYAARYSVSGRYDGKDGMTLQTRLTNGDTLPNGLRWCSGTSSLTIYKDAERSGHYILKGTARDDCGGSSDFEFTDR